MSDSSFFHDVPSPLRHRLFAWLALLLPLAGATWLVFAALESWADTQAEFDGLSQRLAAMQGLQRDSRPLETALAKLNGVPAASLGYLDAPTEEQAMTALERTVMGRIASHQAQLTEIQRLPPEHIGAQTGLRLRVSFNMPSQSLFALLSEMDTAMPSLFVGAIDLNRTSSGAISAMVEIESFWVAP